MPCVVQPAAEELKILHLLPLFDMFDYKILYFTGCNDDFNLYKRPAVEL